MERTRVRGQIVIPSHLVFLVNLFILVVTYGLFFQLKFTVDTYSHIYLSTDGFLNGHLSMGRPLAAIITIALKNMGINDGLHQYLYVATCVFCVCLSITVLFKLLEKEIKPTEVPQVALIDIAALIGFVNVFFVSWFMYTEASILMGVGALIMVWCVGLIANKEYTLKSCIGATILLVCSISLYQVYFESFVISSCMLIMARYKMRFSKNAIINIIKVLLIALAAIAANMILTSILCRLIGITLSTRSAVMDVEVIWKNILYIVAFHKQLWHEGLNLLPSNTMLVFVGVLIVLLIMSTCGKRHGILDVLMCVAVIMGSYVIVFAPHYVSPVFWPAERTLFPLFFVFGLLIILITLNNKNKWILKCTSLICLLFLSINIVSIQDIASDQQITNALDQEYALMIDNLIKEHESTNNIEVKMAGIITDISPSYGYYTQVDKIIYDTNITAKSHSWCYLPMLNYYTNRSLIGVDIPEEVFKMHFEGKNWNGFKPEEQVVFSGDTVYICSY